MAIETILYSLGFPLVRGVLGWLENALEDGVVSKFEWKALGSTIVRIGTPVLIVALGVTAIDASEAIIVLSAGVSTLVDVLWNKYKHATIEE